MSCPLQASYSNSMTPPSFNPSIVVPAFGGPGYYSAPPSMSGAGYRPLGQYSMYMSNCCQPHVLKLCQGENCNQPKSKRGK